MALSNALFDTMLDAAAERATTASLHTADPGSNGASEVTGGSYARQAVTWQSASGGAVEASATISFPVPGGTTVTHLGLWDDTDTWLGGIQLSQSETYGADGTYEVTTLRLTAANAA